MSDHHFRPTQRPGNCINLDPHADEYVRDIFGNQFILIDRVERLPAKLPQLFMALTK